MDPPVAGSNPASDPQHGWSSSVGRAADNVSPILVVAFEIASCPRSIAANDSKSINC